MDENIKENHEELSETAEAEAKEQPEAADEYDPESYYEKDSVYDFVEDEEGIRRSRKNRGAAAATFVIAVILISTGFAAKTLLGKIGDAKLKRDDGRNDKPFAVTELDSSSAADEESDDEDDDDEDVEEADTSTNSDGLPETVLPDASKEKRYAAHASDLHDLKSELGEMMQYYPGEWSVYIQELSTGSEITIENEPKYAASLIKLFAMAACYQRIKDGRINEDYAYNYIYRMITESDNNAFDTVVDLMGEDYFSEWLMQNGYWDTTFVHKLGDGIVYEGKRSPDGDNFTSVKDVGNLLSKIYRGEMVDLHYSEEMVKILKDQTKTNKIPAGLPDGVEYGNKTGETDNVCHDAAIVYSDGGDYIIVVMAKDEGEAWVCNPFVTDISRAVYDYFNTLVGDDSGTGISADEYYDDEYEFDDEELENPPYEDDDIDYEDDEDEW